MINIKSLRVDYDDLNAVCDVNLDIGPGQIFGLVGPNGAGKTSMIKAIAGIIEPTYGEIKIAGFDMELESENALGKLGYMPDFSPVYENLKVWEYLDVFAAAYLIDRSVRPEKVEHWIKRVNLQDKTNTVIRELSRGMRQRLVLAKTLLHDPDVLLLDEPASGLDPIARKDLHDILKSVAEEKKTILISSHILTELSDFCNAIGIMEKGKMVLSGSLDDIRKHINSTGQLVIRLAVANQETIQKLTTFLQIIPFLTNIKHNNSIELQASFSGDPNDASALLAKLVREGFSISTYFVKEANVEEIFFHVGAKQVS